jgi:hypothetical protein
MSLKIGNYLRKIPVISSYSCSPYDDLIECNTSSGNIVVTLPSATLVPGRLIYVSKVSADSNTVTITSIQTINGLSSIVFTGQNETIGFASINGVWISADVGLRSVQTSIFSNTSNKNYLINGNFDIWQRGLSFSAGQKYTADRFWQDTNNITTLSQQDSSPPVGSSKYVRAACTTGPALVALYQALELDTVKTIRDKTVTFSVLLRRNATHSVGSFSLVIQTSATSNAVNTGFSNLSVTTVPASSVTTGTGTSDWTKIFVTATIPSGVNGLRFGLYPDSNNATGAYWESAQWQVNEGSIPSAFQLAGGSIGGELSLCQRYCFVPINNGSAVDGAWIVPLQALSATFALGMVPIPVSFFKVPTLTTDGSFEVITGTSIISPTAIIVSPDSSPNICVIRVDVSAGYTVNNYYHLRYANGITGSFVLSAEL